ncbi:MAG: hypothetical protein M1837_002512 [Sclerophora amabilis]|nr:MAG: hypothetical protein M1837_002512 [Sclerophora amabilis]
MSRPNLHDSALFATPCRAVYFFAPGTLVRVGPNLDAALHDLVDSLSRKCEKLHRNTARHVATTYSLKTITVVIDTFAENHDANVDIQHPQLKRLRLANDKMVGQTVQHQELQNRVAGQLSKIFKYRPDISLPFMCVEPWDGLGPSDHPIYENMNRASSSLQAFRAFKASIPGPPPDERKARLKSMDTPRVSGISKGPSQLEVSSTMPETGSSAESQKRAQSPVEGEVTAAAEERKRRWPTSGSDESVLTPSLPPTSGSPTSSQAESTRLPEEFGM